MVNKVLAGGVTIVFMALVQPDSDASRVGIVFVSLLMYEVVRYCIDYIRKERRRSRYIKAMTISRQDIKRWSDQRFTWPMEEIS